MITHDSSLFRVLRSFESADVLGFTKIAEMLGFETDLAGYYLRRLQARGLIEKIDRGRYRITPLGKSALAHARQLAGLTIVPRTVVMLVVSFQDTYLVVERMVQPFIGKVEWPTAQLGAGESIVTAANRVISARLGLQAQPTFQGMFRRIDMLEGEVFDEMFRRIDMLEGEVFDDKLFAVHSLVLDETRLHELVTKNQIGTILRLTEIELITLPNRAKSLLDILNFTKAAAPFAEHVYELDHADLYS